MYTITVDNLMALTFGIPMFVVGLMMVFMRIRKALICGIDEEDLPMLSIPIVLLVFGIIMILIGLGVLVVV